MRTAVGALLLGLLAACSTATAECDGQAACAPPSQGASPLSRPDGTPVESYDGADVVWPASSADLAAPPVLGALRSTGPLRTSAGAVLPPGLLLPRVGGTATAPVVLTPCGGRVTVTGPYDVVPPRGDAPVVLLDPGHGGSADGARGPDGAREADRNLQVARRVEALLRGRVLLTRSSDHDASLPYRVALADSLRADLSVSLHLNAAPLGELDRPGTSVFGSVQHPEGRRAAGVVHEALRRYVETLEDRVGGRWAGNADAGALYRLGATGGDFYGLLRLSSTPWVIAEPLYLSDPEEAALVADPAVQQGLAQAYADGVRSYLSGAQGSGWREPLPSGPVKDAPPAPCTDPVA